jgi:DNA-binding NarL/FixJ family response regulator
VSKINIIIAEKSYLIRAGLSGIIQALGGCDIVFEIVDEKKLKKKIEKHKPDILIINSNLLTKNQEILTENQTKNKRIKIIVLKSGSENNNFFRFCDKIIDIVDDKSTISKAISELIRNLKPQNTNSNDDISEREKEIVTGVALGKTNKQIADELFISTHNVVSHRKNIVRKLGIKTVSGLTVYAILNKIISINDVENQK